MGVGGEVRKREGRGGGRGWRGEGLTVGVDGGSGLKRFHPFPHFRFCALQHPAQHLLHTWFLGFFRFFFFSIFFFFFDATSGSGVGVFGHIRNHCVVNQETMDITNHVMLNPANHATPYSTNHATTYYSRDWLLTDEGDSGLRFLIL